MEKKFIKITFLLAAITSFSYLVFTFIRYYNDPDNIEKRCIIKFQEQINKSKAKSDEEWGLNMDIANENYFKCLKIP